jgi:hypothetical protein
MRVSTEAELLGGSRPNPKGVRWESVGTFWSTSGDEVASGTDYTIVLGTRVTPDSLDSQRGAASRLALFAPPPPLSAGEGTGQARVSSFHRVGKASSISPPAGGLSTAIVAVARRGKEYHVVAAVEGHELETPETEHRPGLERLLETAHLELDGKLFVNTQ